MPEVEMMRNNHFHCDYYYHEYGEATWLWFTFKSYVKTNPRKSKQEIQIYHHEEQMVFGPNDN